MDFSTKKSLPFVFFVLTSVLALLLLGWSFVAVVSGYGIITLWAWGVFYIFAALFQIFVLIDIVLLLIIGIWGWLNSVGKAKELKIGNWGMKTLGEVLFSVFLGLVLLVFIFLVIASQGVTFGSVLYLLVVLGSFITYLVLRGKGIIEQDGLFACVQINKKAGNSKSKKSDAIEIKINQDQEKEEPKETETEKEKEPVKETPKSSSKK